LYLVELQNVKRIIGNFNFTNFAKGPFQACNLGFSIDQTFEGRGYMREAAKVAISHVFREMNMHRIMANYRPENGRSERLLTALGFQKEGLARDYLFLDGAWRDHVLTSLVNPDWQEE
jgi:[ribosomal protein S5]-alanine N-acetyltransferase